MFPNLCAVDSFLMFFFYFHLYSWRKWGYFGSNLKIQFFFRNLRCLSVFFSVCCVPATKNGWELLLKVQVVAPNWELLEQTKNWFMAGFVSLKREWIKSVSFQLFVYSAYQPKNSAVFPIYNPLPGSWFVAAFLEPFSESLGFRHKCKYSLGSIGKW